MRVNIEKLKLKDITQDFVKKLIINDIDSLRNVIQSKDSVFAFASIELCHSSYAGLICMDKICEDIRKDILASKEIKTASTTFKIKEGVSVFVYANILGPNEKEYIISVKVKDKGRLETDAEVIRRVRNEIKAAIVTRNAKMKESMQLLKKGERLIKEGKRLIHSCKSHNNFILKKGVNEMDQS